MIKVFQNFLQSSSSSAGRKGSKRRSSITDSQQYSTDVDVSGSSFGDPLDQSHRTLRSDASCQALDFSGRIRVSATSKTVGGGSGSRSLSFVIPAEPHNSSNVVKDSKASPAVKPISIKEDSEGTMETTHSIDFDAEGEYNDNSCDGYSSRLQQQQNTIQAERRKAIDDMLQQHRDEDGVGGVEDEHLHQEQESNCGIKEPKVASMKPQSTLRSSDQSSSSTATSRTGKQVHFGQLEIYEHLIDVGGAVPSTGPSLTLQDEAQASYSFSVDDYEEYRPTLPRRGSQLLRSKAQRMEL